MHDLYTGTLWKTYRKARDRHEGEGWRQGPVGGRHPALDVYVVSADKGLVRAESGPYRPYNAVVVSDSYTGPNPTRDGARAVSVSEVARPLKYQRKGHLRTARSGPFASNPALRVGHPIYFAGGKLYREALERAGFDVVSLAPKARGIGDHAGALKRFLNENAEPPLVDLDAIIAQVTR
jgi:hypothetical protein